MEELSSTVKWNADNARQANAAMRDQAFRLSEAVSVFRLDAVALSAAAATVRLPG
jgi:hypothetical protein